MPAALAAATPGDAGDAVVHRDQELGAAGHRQLDDLGGEAITELEAVGHQKIDVTTAHGAQGQHAQRRAGGAVAVKVTDDENAFCAVSASASSGTACAMPNRRWGGSSWLALRSSRAGSSTPRLAKI